VICGASIGDVAAIILLSALFSTDESGTGARLVLPGSASTDDRVPCTALARAARAWEQQPAERLVTTEALDRVPQTIVRLPAQQQTVITLRDIEGLTSGGVCDLLDLTPASQRVLLHRARVRVRRGLEDYFTGVDA
jgi:DNA-directed RNA polymerase specialized sigma24 family protein